MLVRMARGYFAYKIERNDCMSIIESGLQKGYENQRKSLIKQIKEAGFTLVEFSEIESEQKKASSAVTSTLKSVVGGKLKPDYWQVYLIENNNRKQVYIQPYSGSAVLPGEHHMYIKGSIDYAIALDDFTMLGVPIWSSSNTDYAKKLNKEEKQLKKAVKEIVFNWPIGASKIDLDWTIQVYSIGNGTSKVVMKTGRYGGITTYEVGFLELNNVVNELLSIIKNGSGSRQIPLKNAVYDDMADKIIRTTSQSTNHDFSADNINVEEKVEGREYKEIIQSTVRPHLSKHVFLSEIPRKQEMNFRKYVMSDEFSNQSIVAAFDHTIFKSAKTGVVFTESHCFAKEDDIEVAFELDSLISIKSMEINKDDQIELILTSGNILVPIGVHEELIEVFNEIIKERKDLKKHFIIDNKVENDKVDKRVDMDEKTQSFYFKGEKSEESFKEAKKIQDELLSSLSQEKEETKEINKAAQLLVNQQFDEAIKAYESLCEKYPNSRGIYESQIGAAFFFKNDYHTAVEYYLKSMDHGFTDDADYNLWEAYEILYKQSKDNSYINKYLKLFPNGEYVSQANKILEK